MNFLLRVWTFVFTIASLDWKRFPSIYQQISDANFRKWLYVKLDFFFLLCLRTFTDTMKKDEIRILRMNFFPRYYRLSTIVNLMGIFYVKTLNLMTRASGSLKSVLLNKYSYTFSWIVIQNWGFFRRINDANENVNDNIGSRWKLSHKYVPLPVFFCLFIGSFYRYDNLHKGLRSYSNQLLMIVVIPKSWIPLTCAHSVSRSFRT